MATITEAAGAEMTEREALVRALLCTVVMAFGALAIVALIVVVFYVLPDPKAFVNCWNATGRIGNCNIEPWSPK